MSFKANNAEYQQMSMMDSFTGLTPRELKFLEKSWAKYFGDYIFPKINEAPFAVLYSSKDSRPNCPVNIQVGALMLKELNGMSDDDILQALMFDVRFQYALHTTTYDEQPLSDRTLGRFRERCASYETATGKDLIGDAIKELSGQMAEMMKIDRSLKRMDSLMIASNIKKMSRLELLYTVVANMVKEVVENGVTLPEGLEHYTDSGDRNVVIYHNRGEDTAERISKILNEARILKDFCEPDYDESSNYQMLLRVLQEQTVEENGEYRLRTKEDGGMDSNIVQNPSDPDATFREKAGREHRGYAANVLESSGENGSIIEDFQLEKNNYSDNAFLKDELEALGKQQDTVTIVADGAYGSSESRKLAEENNITIVNTNLTGRESEDIAADFIFSEDGTSVLSCPAGHKPKSCSYNKTTGQCAVSFHRKHCESCPFRDKCRPKESKKTFKKIVSVKSKQRAIQQRSRNTDDFKAMSHFRNGVESVPSILRRKYHVDKMPVRGLIRVRMFFAFKIGALNFNRFCTYMQGLDSCAVPAKS